MALDIRGYVHTSWKGGTIYLWVAGCDRSRPEKSTESCSTEQVLRSRTRVMGSRDVPSVIELGQSDIMQWFKRETRSADCAMSGRNNLSFGSRWLQVKRLYWSLHFRWLPYSLLPLVTPAWFNLNQWRQSAPRYQLQWDSHWRASRTWKRQNSAADEDQRAQKSNSGPMANAEGRYRGRSALSLLNTGDLLLLFWWPSSGAFPSCVFMNKLFLTIPGLSQSTSWGASGLSVWDNPMSIWNCSPYNFPEGHSSERQICILTIDITLIAAEYNNHS